MGKLLKILVSIAIVLLVGGSVYYYYQGYQEKRSVMKAVKEYDQALSRALESSSIEPLASYATQVELRRVQAYIFFNYSEGKFMKSDLKKIKFTKVKVSGKKAEVNAEEEWTYQYLDLRTKRPLENLEKVKYRAKYKLSKTNGRWVVSKVEAKEVGKEE